MVTRTTFSLKTGYTGDFGTIFHEIIESIPDSFGYVRGFLRAPTYILNSLEIADSTELIFSTSICQIINSVDNDKRPDFLGILFGNKKPVKVQFGRDFNYCEILSIAQIKEIILHFDKLFYTGTIRFDWSEEDGNERFSCEISTLPALDESGSKMFVVISYEEDDIDKHGELHRPIINACMKNGLIQTTKIDE